MFEFLTHSGDDAILLIKKDHDTVKDLFDRFEKAEDLRDKRRIASETILELKLHAAIEEEIFYAAVRAQIGKKVMNEADEEHHVAKLLIAELEEMDGTESHYDAKYKVLSENIRHHIKEEESDMLVKARDLSLDFDALGKQIIARKEELKQNGFPVIAEEKMVARSNGKGDSPAQNASLPRPRIATAKAKSRKPAKVVKFTRAVKSLAKKAKKALPAKTAKRVSSKKTVMKKKTATSAARKKAGRR